MRDLPTLVSLPLKRVFFARWMGPWTWPDGIEATEWRQLRTRSRSGAMLACLHGPAHGRRELGTLVLAHPLGRACKAHWLKDGQADFLRRAGYNVVLFDFNGFGESGPGSFDYPADVIAAGRLAKRLHPHVPVGLLGASLGAGFGLCSLADPAHPFACALLEAPFLSLPAYWRKHRVPFVLLKAMSWLAPRLARRLHPEHAASRIVHAPRVHLLHGGSDAVAPPEVGAVLHRAMRGTADARLTILPAAGHVDAHRVDPRRYRELILDCFASCFASCRPAHAEVGARG